MTDQLIPSWRQLREADEPNYVGPSQDTIPGFEWMGSEEDNQKRARDYVVDIPAAQARLDRIADGRLN